MRLAVLIGSLRPDSLNRRLAEAAIRMLPPSVVVEVIGGLGELPLYDETHDVVPAPAPVAQLRAQLAASDALLVVTPEYNGSLPGGLKNAIDWLSRPRGEAVIAGVPAAVLGASGSPRAAQWAREDAVRVLRVAGADPIATTVGVPSAWRAFSSSGDLLDDGLAAEVQGLLGDLLGSARAAA